MEDILAVILIFGGGTAIGVAFSPIGRAIADRIRGPRPDPLPLEELDDLRAQVQGLREQMTELAERQDFAERVLAQAREKGLLGPAPGAR